MESETIDNLIIVDGDFGNLVVRIQTVVLPLAHCTIIVCKCIVTPSSILEYHVEQLHSTSFFKFIVFKSNQSIVKLWIIRECLLIHTLLPLWCL